MRTPGPNGRKKGREEPGHLARKSHPGETLEAVLARLGIDRWDFLLFGDGSGSDFHHEAGWGCVSIERATMERLAWDGCVSRGTVNFAEAMAYLQAMTWFDNRENDRRKRSKLRRRIYDVHIVTDSEYCQQVGGGRNRQLAKNSGVWAWMDAIARNGFVFHWHHTPRGSVDLNIFVDELSKLARKLRKAYNIQERVGGEAPRIVYDVNPSAGG